MPKPMKPMKKQKWITDEKLVKKHLAKYKSVEDFFEDIRSGLAEVRIEIACLKPTKKK